MMSSWFLDIAVRIGANLQSGDITCIVIDVYDPNLNTTQRRGILNTKITFFLLKFNYDLIKARSTKNTEALFFKIP